MIKDYQKGGTQKDIYFPEDVEDVNCLNCGNKNKKKIHNEFGVIGIVQCTNCKLIFTSPRAKNSEKNYDGNIENFELEYRYIFSGDMEHHRDKNYKQEIYFIKKHIQFGNLLDVGCNTGRFLSLAIKEGFKGYGIEPSKSLAELAKNKMNLEVENCTLNKTKHKNKFFDIITAIDVFEHIIKPKDFLKDCFRLLNDKGRLVIKIPNGNYSMLKLKLARLFNREIKKMDIFDSYEHVVHHTKDSLKTMVETNHFEIEKIYSPYPISPPVWSKYVGQYYQYPSPWILDWKKNLFRIIFHAIGKIEVFFDLKTYFQADLMFILKKK